MTQHDLLHQLGLPVFARVRRDWQRDNYWKPTSARHLIPSGRREPLPRQALVLEEPVAGRRRPLPLTSNLARTITISGCSTSEAPPLTAKRRG